MGETVGGAVFAMLLKNQAAAEKLSDPVVGRGIVRTEETPLSSAQGAASGKRAISPGCMHARGGKSGDSPQAEYRSLWR